MPTIYTVPAVIIAGPLAVTELCDAFEGGTYTATTDADELAGWLEHIATDGGTVVRIAGEVPAAQLSTVDRLAASAGLRRIMSAPITHRTFEGEVGPGYAVAYAGTLPCGHPDAGMRDETGGCMMPRCRRDA